MELLLQAKGTANAGSKMNKIILDLCGGSGEWSRPYREAGYDVINVTLPNYDVRKYNGIDNVYGILAAPPCQMFSLARTTAKITRDLRQGMECVEACMKIIWECRQRNKLKFWALENPRGILRQFLGKPAFTFDPFEFGHDYSKKTDIWGYFNEPRKKLRKLTDEEIKLCRTNSRKLMSIGDTNDARRSITPSGFAKAFFEANK